MLTDVKHKVRKAVEKNYTCKKRAHPIPTTTLHGSFSPPLLYFKLAELEKSETGHTR